MTSRLRKDELESRRETQNTEEENEHSMIEKRASTRIKSRMISCGSLHNVH